jgi:nitrous oxide reductase accessory protein NosL
MRTTMYAALAAATLLAACASAPEPTPSNASQADSRTACRDEPRTGSNIGRRCSPEPSRN